MKIKSVKSFNQCESAVQPIFNIVKAHGVELTVETKVKKESTFILQLPYKLNND